ncbi:MAG: L,D-transpeptidase [Nitrospira sp.]|nr:L,D-transpeptidase [Nitrospira sp.]MDH4328395.1 L,D-transpeptidase [Nitrospira sp.]MDH5253048.1 L,D-transpeptidase [Nitrospira sp.]
MASVPTALSSLILIGLLVADVPPNSQALFPSSEPFTPSAPTKAGGHHLQSLQAQYKSLSEQLSRLKPHQPYILVDTARNHLYVKRRQEVVLDAIASTGSGTILDKPGEGNDQWVFDTPRGEFLVQSKLTHPAWVKPDWAFIEEGQEIPTNQADRVEQGVLGEYALGFGKGYFIHGTLYTRFLGKNVTHGCIRLNDGDLKRVYTFARIGTPIIIF